MEMDYGKPALALAKKALEQASAASGGGFIYAHLFPGENGGEKIQNALNSKTGWKCVVVATDGPDDGGVWLIKQTLKIPSQTLIKFMSSRIMLDAGVNNPIMSNSDYVNGNTDIHIYGEGMVEINGNGRNQNLSLNNWRNIGIHLYKVKAATIQNIRLAATARWSMVPEACENVVINNIDFALEGYENQDGIHILGPSKNIIANNIRGTFGDDACVCNARPSTGGTNIFQGYGTGGDISNIVFNNVHAKGMSIDGFFRTGILRTSAGGSNSLKGIILNNATGENVIAIARLGGNQTTTSDLHRNIIINNIQLIKTPDVTAGAGIYVLRPVGDVKVTNVTQTSDCPFVIIDNYPTGWDGPSDVDGLIVNNYTLRSVAGPPSMNYAIKFKGGTIKNAEFSGIKLIGPTGGTSRLTGVWFKDTVVQDVKLDLYLRDLTSIMKTEGTTTLDNVRINYSYRNLSSAPWDLLSPNGLIRNGVGSETANAETPTASKWMIGDVVEFIDSGDATGNGIYLLLPSGSWAKVA